MDEISPEYRSEIHRKAVHLFGLAIPVGYMLVPQESHAKAILITVMVVSVAVDIWRLNEPRLRGFLHGLVGAFMRPHEKTNLLGSTCLVIASTMTVLIFPKGVAVGALCLLVGGDTAAALVGRRFGRVKVFGAKTLEGTLAFIGTGLALNLAVGWVLPRLAPGTASLSPTAAAVGALVGGLIEAVPLPLDDNFAIPITSGVAMVVTGIISA
jgi:dolichol kinase